MFFRTAEQLLALYMTNLFFSLCHFLHIYLDAVTKTPFVHFFPNAGKLTINAGKFPVVLYKF